MQFLASLQPAIAFIPDLLAQSGAAEASPATVQSVWDFLVKGGPMMIPIGLCSLLALAVITERALTLRRRSIIPQGFLIGLQESLGEDGSRPEAAISYCENNPSPIANVFRAGLRRLQSDVPHREKAIEEAGQREIFQLRRRVRLLSVIAALAPIMGLLGTIFGMITAFQTVAVAGEALGKTELLAKGIYEALISTAAGLTLALPTLVAFHWISAKIEQLVHEMDQVTVEFFEDHWPALAVVAKPESVTARDGQSQVGNRSNGDGRFDNDNQTDGDGAVQQTSIANHG